MHQLAADATTLAPGGTPHGSSATVLDPALAVVRADVPGRVAPPDPPARRTPSGPPPSRGRRLLRSAGPEALALVVAASVFGLHAGTPSPWRDEGATMVIAGRPLPEMLELLRHLDLVHATYYLVVKALLVVLRPDQLGDAVPAVRAISVVGASLAAVLLVRIGRRLGGPCVGLAAAFALVASPLASRYAQEARSYALVMMATALATLLMLRLAQHPTSRRARAWYAASLVVTALLNVIALLVVVAHAVYVRSMQPKPVRRAWLVGAAWGIGVAAPYTVATFLQRGQVDWLYPPTGSQLADFYAVQYDQLVALLAVLAAALLLVAVPGRAARIDPRRLLPARMAARVGSTNTHALVLGLAWAVLPVVVLWTVSQVEPLYTWRYVVFTLPGTALVVASLAPVLRPAGFVVPLLVLAVAGFHMQGVYRDAHIGHAEDMAGVGEFVAAHARPGDAVLWVPGGPGHMRTMQELYPERYAGLIDVALERSGAATATITGVEKEPEQIASALKKRTRVFLISADGALGRTSDAVDREKVQLLLDGYRITTVDVVHNFQVIQWEKASARKK